MNMATYIMDYAQKNKKTVPSAIVPKFTLMVDTITPVVSEGKFTAEDVITRMTPWLCERTSEEWNNTFPLVKETLLQYQKAKNTGGDGDPETGDCNEGDNNPSPTGQSDEPSDEQPEDTPEDEGEGDSDEQPEDEGEGNGDSDEQPEDEGEGNGDSDEEPEGESEDESDDEDKGEPGEEPEDNPDDSKDEPESDQPTPQQEDNEIPPSKNLDIIVYLLKQRCNVMLIGPTGTGKTYDALKAADVLGMRVCIVASPMMKHEIEGFLNAMGKLVMVSFTDAFQNGGLLIIEEMDASGPDALIGMNSAIANGVMNIPGIGLVHAHPDFRVVATANTAGLGATEDYNTRNALDRSTLDRFVTVSYEYDMDIEKAIGGEELANFAEAYRFVGAQCGINTAQITYRSITNIKKIMDADGKLFGMKGSITRASWALDIGLFHEQLDLDAITTISKQMPNSIYTKGMKAYVKAKTKKLADKQALIERLKTGVREV